MASYILNKKVKTLETDIFAKSCGIAAYNGSLASENSVKALKEIDIDLSDHRSKMLTKEDVEQADIVLTMTNSHKLHILQYFSECSEKVYTLHEYSTKEKLDISDPFMGSIEIYRACRDEINHLLEIVVNNILKCQSLL